MFRLGAWGPNFGLNGGIPQLADAKDANCFVCKERVETVNYFFLGCPGFKETFDYLWDKLKTKARDFNPVDGDQIVNFIANLDQHHKMRHPSGGLQLPFDDITTNSIKEAAK